MNKVYVYVPKEEYTETNNENIRLTAVNIELNLELQRKDNNWNELKKYIKNIDDNENSFGDYEIDYRTKQELLDKIKELEENK